VKGFSAYEVERSSTTAAAPIEPRPVVDKEVER
jgi:hypothetical protein